MEGNSIELASTYVDKSKNKKIKIAKPKHDDVYKAESLFGVKFRGDKDEKK
jgi:hypothetical protein